MIPPYKAESGNWYTGSLFWEVTRTNVYADRPIDAVFSFRGQPGFIDAHKTFIELEDPTGYKWAMQYLKSWDHFIVLLKSKWFRAEYDSWVEELKIIFRQRALEKIKQIAAGDSVQALAAAKYIAAAEWEKGKRGRPSKDEVSGEMKKAMAEAASDADDARRVLTVIPGGRQ